MTARKAKGKAERDEVRRPVSALSVALAVNIMTPNAPREVVVRCPWCLDREDPTHSWSLHRWNGYAECMGCPYSGPDVVLAVRPRVRALLLGEGE
jgi:hypothetical protein